MGNVVSSSLFDVSIIKEFLLNIKISDEVGEELGVSPGQLEEWMHELAFRLEEILSVSPRCRSASVMPCEMKLSAEELHFLLGTSC